MPYATQANPWDFSGGASRQPTLEEQLAEMARKAASPQAAPAPAAPPQQAPAISLQIKPAKPAQPKAEKPRKLTTAAPGPVPPHESLSRQGPSLAEQMGIAPVPKGSGLTQDASNKTIDALKQALEDAQKSGTKDVSTKLLTPEEVAQIDRNIQGSEFYKGQKAGLDRQEAEIEARLANKKIEPDLVTPIGDLAHYLTTGVYTNTVKPGMTGDQRDELLLNHYGKLQDDKRDLAKTALDFYGKSKTGTIENTLGRILTIKDERSNQDIFNQGAKAEDPNKFIKDKAGPKAYDPTKDIKELGKARATYGASMISSMNQIDGALRDAGIDGIAGLNKESDVPGVGLKAWATPLAMLTGEGSQLYQSALDLALAKLQMRSGAQASESEARRYLKQLGLTPTSGKREFVTGLKKLVQETKGQLAADEARFDPRAVQEYSKRPDRVLSKDLEKFITPSPGGSGKLSAPKNATKAPARSKPLDQMTDAELEAYEKSLTGGK